MQVMYIDKDTGEIIEAWVLTESYTIIKAIQNTQNELPHYTKFRRSKGYILCTQLNEKEKYPLINL